MRYEDEDQAVKDFRDQVKSYLEDLVSSDPLIKEKYEFHQAVADSATPSCPFVKWTNKNGEACTGYMLDYSYEEGTCKIQTADRNLWTVPSPLVKEITH